MLFSEQCSFLLIENLLNANLGRIQRRTDGLAAQNQRVGVEVECGRGSVLSCTLPEGLKSCRLTVFFS